MRIDFQLLMIIFQLFFRKTSTALEIGHGKCRSLVCVVCYQKASRSLSELEIKNIQDYLIDGYSSSHSEFPNGICTGSSIALSKKRKDSTISLPIVENYDPERKTGLRSLNPLSCKICSVAKLNGLNVLLASQKIARNEVDLQHKQFLSMLKFVQIVLQRYTGVAVIQ